MIVYLIIGLYAGVLAFLIATVIKQGRQIDKLFEHTAKIAARQSEIMKNHEELMAAEMTAEDRIAEKIEKKWDDGLQRMMNWNPFEPSGESEAK